MEANIATNRYLCAVASLVAVVGCAGCKSSTNLNGQVPSIAKSADSSAEWNVDEIAKDLIKNNAIARAQEYTVLRWAITRYDRVGEFDRSVYSVILRARYESNWMLYYAVKTPWNSYADGWSLHHVTGGDVPNSRSFISCPLTQELEQFLEDSLWNLFMANSLITSHGQREHCQR